MSLEAPTAPDMPRYARFSRRLRAMFLDWTLSLALMFGALMVASHVESDVLARVLGAAVVLILLLYEPVLVWRGGGTLGHTWTNLRVVADDGGGLSFARALGRFALKNLLGWYSFLSMAATRRNQAIHDLLTRSTVQIRDPAKADPGQFITERSQDDQAMPSWLRRIFVIAGYLVLSIFLYFGVVAALLEGGAMSRACLNRDVCSGGDRLVEFVILAAWLLMMALVIGMGWRGRLFGARKS